MVATLLAVWAVAGDCQGRCGRDHEPHHGQPVPLVLEEVKGLAVTGVSDYIPCQAAAHQPYADEDHAHRSAAPGHGDTAGQGQASAHGQDKPGGRRGTPIGGGMAMGGRANTAARPLVTVGRPSIAMPGRRPGVVAVGVLTITGNSPELITEIPYP